MHTLGTKSARALRFDRTQHTRAIHGHHRMKQLGGNFPTSTQLSVHISTMFIKTQLDGKASCEIDGGHILTINKVTVFDCKRGNYRLLYSFAPTDRAYQLYRFVLISTFKIFN